MLCADLGEVWCAHLGEVWCAHLGEVLCAHLGEVWCAHLSEVLCAYLGEVLCAHLVVDSDSEEALTAEQPLKGEEPFEDFFLGKKFGDLTVDDVDLIFGDKPSIPNSCRPSISTQYLRYTGDLPLCVTSSLYV